MRTPLRSYFPNSISICLPALIALTQVPAFGQIHPPEVRQIYPIGGSVGSTTRVTIGGISFRGVRKLVFDKPGFSAKIIPELATASPPAVDNDGIPVFSAEITIAPGSEPGVVAFRVVSDAGVSNVVKWMAGREIPSIEEKEPNNSRSEAQALKLPVSVNGRISQPGDEDVFAFELEEGKTFVAEVDAAVVDSSLDSALILSDEKGMQVASAEDFNGTDSLLRYTPKAPGKYFLTIRSSVGAGSGNDNYRLNLGVLPVITGTYPASLVRGKTEKIDLFGSNIPSSISVTVPTDYRSGLMLVHASGAISSNSISAGVISSARTIEFEPNDDRGHATPLSLPAVANGVFNLKPGGVGGDLDFYQFHVEAGQRFLFDVQCQDRSGVRADPILTLYDSAGIVIAENDDTFGKDSHIDMAFSKTGDYYVRIKNQTDQTGVDLSYQLLVSLPPEPGFSLSTETRNRAIPLGGVSIFEIALTRDRWDAPVEIGIDDLPAGVRAFPLVIPSGSSKGILILKTESNAPIVDFPIHIWGKSEQGKQKNAKTSDARQRLDLERGSTRLDANSLFSSDDANLSDRSHSES